MSGRSFEGIAKKQLGGVPPVYLDVRFEDGVWIEPERFCKIIREAGYRVRDDDVWLTAIGILHRTEGKLIFSPRVGQTIHQSESGAYNGQAQPELTLAEPRKPSERHVYSNAQSLVLDSNPVGVKVTARWRSASQAYPYEIILMSV